MKAIILFLFLSSTNLLWANYPSLQFDKKKVKVNYQNFHRYIIPQASAIVKEYYHVLRKLNPLHSDIIDLKDKVEKIQYLYNKRTIGCYKTEGLCYKEISKLYKLSRDVDLLLLKNQMKYSFLSNKNLKNQVDNIILVSTKLAAIGTYNYQLMHIFEEQLLTISTRYEINSDAKEKLNKLILRIISNTNILVTAFVPPNFKMEFDSVWEFFIKNLERHILQRKDKIYLINRLGDLNMTWNSFHMKVSKGNFPLRSKLLKIISIQHNRWNSILKVVLRGY